MFQREYSKKYTDYLNNKPKNMRANYNLNRNEDSLLSNVTIYPQDNK
jgi:hypothetical protein